uniref:Trigger factor ribosome-binding bacterial domain-containing protein n=1 Tax=Amphora coffeiformis TaxID=265554 RepID=A0A7S3LBL7_9STRA|eukprot:scaffold337_cov172-Amphora_coffeaeformis.AAC.2
MTRLNNSLTLLFLSSIILPIRAFSSAPKSVGVRHLDKTCHHILRALNADGTWNGEVASNTSDGRIQGCMIQPAKQDSLTEWEVTIDGVQADLGRFSDAVYKKVMQDAKQQRFQGFRPGTIPPHLEPTYRTFAMDECARETVLEALQQNNIKPFENCRSEMYLKDFQIPPPKSKKGKKKKGNTEVEEEPEPEPTWRSFETMKEAINAGWRPGQSFSFVAVDVKGQKVKAPSETDGAKPLGLTN